MPSKLMLGTYTRGNSEGIYSIELNKEKKQLENLNLESKIGSPTYHDITFNGDKLYSVIDKEDNGGVGSYQIDKNGNLTEIDAIIEEGNAPCYVSLDEKKNFVYSANYHTGKLNVYKTNGEGKLELTDTVQHEGSSVHENQDAPHAHYIDLTPDEKYLVACDLGIDKVITYQVSGEGKLSKVTELNVKPGTGPRHLTFHPNAKQAYLFGELSNEVLVLDYDQNDGSFEVNQTVSTLPEDYKDSSSGAAIRITKDGNHLYASNRGHNSIVAYNIDADGKLEVIDWFPTEGDGPRDFNLDAEDNYLVIGHQYTDNLTLYERNPSTGELTLLQKDIEAPEVVCIKFLNE